MSKVDEMSHLWAHNQHLGTGGRAKSDHSGFLRKIQFILKIE